MKILVTGGAGFIGSHLCKKLLEEYNEVLCMDNFFTGRKENIKDLMNNYRFEIIRHDVTDPIYLRVDQIYNLACPASPIHYQFDPVQTVTTSVIGAINMLELARKNKARILLSSTSEIYGDPLVHPQKEDYLGNVNCIGPRACYDEGKRCAETLFFDYHRQYNVDIKVVRIFNTYGPNMRIDDGRVVSNFIIQALRNEDLTIYGNGQQSRSFQYIDDLIDGITKLMNSTNVIGPINIGNPQEFTIEELAKKILKLIPESKSKIVYLDPVEDDPQQRRPDITMATTKLNWEIKTPLEEGLIKSINYFRSCY